MDEHGQPLQGLATGLRSPPPAWLAARFTQEACPCAQYHNVGRTLWRDLEPVYDIKRAGSTHRLPPHVPREDLLTKCVSERDTEAFSTNGFTQMQHILAREFKLYIRNPAVTVVPIVRGAARHCTAQEPAWVRSRSMPRISFAAIVMGLIIGSLFYQLGGSFIDARARVGTPARLRRAVLGRSWHTSRPVGLIFFLMTNVRSRALPPLPPPPPPPI